MTVKDLPRVLIAHNAYQIRGGEDAVVETELDMLRSRGHEVMLYSRSNDEIPQTTGIGLGADLLWSGRSRDDIAACIRSFKPDVMHCHNTFPLMSPSVYWEAKRHGVPVVKTLHNFRLACPQALMLRNDRPCEDCVGHIPWRAVAHGCYRGSAIQSAGVAGMVQLHTWLGTWRRKIDIYVVLNEFCKDIFTRAGIPEDKIRVRPNSIDLVAPRSQGRAGFLFVGRLSHEKGVALLGEALDRLGGDTVVTVCGSGPLEPLVRDHPRIRYVGNQPPQEIYRLMSNAKGLLVPSLWYENFPRVITEAFACGLPVLASRVGSLPHIVEHRHTGLLFESGNAGELALAMRELDQSPGLMQAFSDGARAKYLSELTTSKGYQSLMSIYSDAMAQAA